MGSHVEVGWARTSIGLGICRGVHEMENVGVCFIQRMYKNESQMGESRKNLGDVSQKVHGVMGEDGCRKWWSHMTW